MNDPLDDSSLRAAALKAERERLAARRAARRKREADHAAWRALGVEPEAIADVRQVLLELTTVAGEAAQDAVRSALDAPPAPDLRRAVADVLRSLAPSLAAAFLRDLQEMGFPLLEPHLVPAVRLLAQDELRPDQLAEAQKVSAGHAWTLYVDVLAVDAGREPVAPRLLVEKAPLMVVGRYLEDARREVYSDWWDVRPPEERAYLTARTRPELLTDQDVEALGWDEELHRRRLASGQGYEPGPDEDHIELFELITAAARGEVDVLDRLEELLPDENASVVRSVRRGAVTGTWAEDILADKGLWRLLARLLPDDRPVDPAAGPFFRWAAFWRAYELTKAGRFADAWAQIKKSAPPARAFAPLDKELQNLRAYLTLMREGAEEKKFLDHAVELLLPMKKDPVVGANLKWLRRRLRQTRNEREMKENPYLLLGVDQGVPTAVWKASWRRLRKRNSGDVDVVSKVNEAKDLIERLERAGSDGRAEIFTVPLRTERLSPGRGKPWKLLVPDPTPLPPPRTALPRTEVARLHAEALTAILDGVR